MVGEGPCAYRKLVCALEKTNGVEYFVLQVLQIH
jgi:hypothetical protein